MLVGSVGSGFWHPLHADLTTSMPAGRDRCDRGVTPSTP